MADDLPEYAHATFEPVVADVQKIEGVWRSYWRGLFALPRVPGDEHIAGARLDAALIMLEKHGLLNLRVLKAELYDAYFLVDNARKVYRHVTGGLTDDLTASAEGINALADRRVLREIETRGGAAAEDVRANFETFKALVRSALDAAGAPTHHADTGAAVRKPMTPQERIAWLGEAVASGILPGVEADGAALQALRERGGSAADIEIVRERERLRQEQAEFREFEAQERRVRAQRNSLPPLDEKP